MYVAVKSVVMRACMPKAASKSSADVMNHRDWSLTDLTWVLQQKILYHWWLKQNKIDTFQANYTTHQVCTRKQTTGLPEKHVINTQKHFGTITLVCSVIWQPAMIRWFSNCQFFLETDDILTVVSRSSLGWASTWQRPCIWHNGQNVFCYLRKSCR